MHNLRSISLAQSAEVDIKDPADGNSIGVKFTLAGPEHPERKRIQFAQSRKALKRYERTGKLDLPDPEEAEATKHENLAAYTLGWTGYVDADGKAVPFSREAALEMYRDPSMGWLVDQLEAALADKERFISRSATV